MKHITRTITCLSGITVITFLLSFVSPPKSVYEIKIKDINGETKALSGYHSKKMVFFILSGNEADSTLSTLAAFCTKYKDSAVVLGILSIEDGYSEGNKAVVKDRYKSKCPGIVLTEGMYTRMASAGQSELMQWLTHVEQNRHGDQEITGPGWKFFVDEEGMLYAGMPPRLALTSPFIQRIMSKPIHRMPGAPAMEKGQVHKQG
jgi:hypothetical protein